MKVEFHHEELKMSKETNHYWCDNIKMCFAKMVCECF